MFRVDRSDIHDWRCRISRGAWKRICSNLVTNANKFTTNGYILVTLRQEINEAVPQKRHAVFCVQDTGRGMSESFMTNSLFRPFKQEDARAPGAGLGMSIVAQLVQSMGGTVDVQSQQGKGTTVSVRVPLEQSETRPSPSLLMLARSPFVQAGVNGVARLLNGPMSHSASEGKASHGKQLLLSAVTQSLGSLGIRVVTAQSTTDRVDIFLVFEEENLPSNFAKLEHAVSAQAGLTPTLIICSSYASAQNAQSRRLSKWAPVGSHVEYIPQPCGPMRLLEAIEACSVGRAPATTSTIPIDTVQVRQGRRRATSLDSGTPRAMRNADGEQHRQKEVDPRRSGTPRIMPIRQRSAFSAVPSEKPNIGTIPLLGKDVQEPLPSLSLSVNAQGGASKIIPGNRSDGRSSGALELMLVDDNQINIQLLSTYCKKRGYLSRVATDGLQALNMYQDAVLMNRSKAITPAEKQDLVSRSTKIPHFILLDINMPVMDGFEAACLIRAFEKEISIELPVTIFAMTGLNSSEARQRAFACGIDQFFAKPVKLKELTKALQSS
nr:virulence sensor protein bvgs [Quercus suber]